MRRAATLAPLALLVALPTAAALGLGVGDDAPLAPAPAASLDVEAMGAHRVGWQPTTSLPAPSASAPEVFVRAAPREIGLAFGDARLDGAHTTRGLDLVDAAADVALPHARMRVRADAAGSADEPSPSRLAEARPAPADVARRARLATGPSPDDATLAPERSAEGPTSPRRAASTAAGPGQTDAAPPPPTPTPSPPPIGRAWMVVATTAASFAFLALLLSGFPLFHRLRGVEVVNGPRAAILDTLRARPGLSAAELARAVGLHAKTVDYHLRRLVKEGLVAATGERRGARYFAAGSVAPAARAALVATRERAPVLEAVRAEPGLTKTALAGRLGVARASVDWHLRRLAEVGLVRVETGAGRARVYPVPTSA